MTFVKTWDETVPAGSRAINLGDNDIRDFKYALRERLAIDHNFKASEGADTNIGKHNLVSLLEQSSDPTVLADAFLLYSKLVGSYSELHGRHENAGVKQLTLNGLLWIAALTIASEAEGDILYRGASAWSRLAKGSAAQVLKMNAGATAPEWGDATAAASAAEVKTGTEAAKYVAPSTMIGHEGMTKGWIQFNGTGTIAINDSYNVSGIVDNGTGEYTVTWDTDFADAKYCVVATGGTSGGYIFIPLHTVAAGSVRLYTVNYAFNPTDTAVVCVMAIGDR